MLEPLLAKVRRQEQILGDAPADYKATAALMGGASP